VAKAAKAAIFKMSISFFFGTVSKLLLSYRKRKGCSKLVEIKKLIIKKPTMNANPYLILCHIKKTVGISFIACYISLA